jgi:hypothetical protein
MRQIILKTVSALFLAAMLSVPALADTASQHGPASPGTLNYMEGQVDISNQQVGQNATGTLLAPDQSLSTQNGKAEVLLTPGVFLRVGDNSSVKMIAESITDTQVQVDRGEAIIEVAEIHRENNLRVDENGAVTHLNKTGLYDFDADTGQIRVLKGEAIVQDADRQVKVKGGHELSLNAPKLKPEGFDKKAFESDDLYRWSSLRSSYVAEANVDAAPRYYAGDTGWYGSGWIGSGWYWDPWFSTYTFIPGDGVFYSPFGWGFYSPVFVGGAPIFFSGRYYHHFGPDFRAWGPGPHYTPGVAGGGFHNGFRPGYGGGVRSGGFGGFHGRSGGFRGGGFHRGGGGFHGGGGGGGFHGGGGHR